MDTRSIDSDPTPRSDPNVHYRIDRSEGISVVLRVDKTSTDYYSNLDMEVPDSIPLEMDALLIVESSPYTPTEMMVTVYNAISSLYIRVIVSTIGTIIDINNPVNLAPLLIPRTVLLSSVVGADRDHTSLKSHNNHSESCSRSTGYTTKDTSITMDDGAVHAASDREM